jgi:hypothetical protein
MLAYVPDGRKVRLTMINANMVNTVLRRRASRLGEAENEKAALRRSAASRWFGVLEERQPRNSDRMVCELPLAIDSA